MKAAGSVCLQIARVNGLHYASRGADLEKYYRKAKQNPYLNCLSRQAIFYILGIYPEAELEQFGNIL